MRLIIHIVGRNKLEAIRRVQNALPEYYRLKGEDDRRLTVSFDGDSMAIYHDRKDIVIFSQSG